MLLSRVMHPVDTLYNITQAHSNKNPNPFPKLLKYLDQSSKQPYISFSEFEERIEIQNDSTTKIAPGDHYYFPPNFHHIPAQKCESNITNKHDSPWNDNFGNKKSTPVKKQGGCREGGQKKNKKRAKTKREKFVDVQVGILKCMIPQFGYLYDLEKAKQKRKRKA